MIPKCGDHITHLDGNSILNVFQDDPAHSCRKVKSSLNTLNVPSPHNLVCKAVELSKSSFLHFQRFIAVGAIKLLDDKSSSTERGKSQQLRDSIIKLSCASSIKMFKRF